MYTCVLRDHCDTTAIHVYVQSSDGSLKFRNVLNISLCSREQHIAYSEEVPYVQFEIHPDTQLLSIARLVFPYCYRTSPPSQFLTLEKTLLLSVKAKTMKPPSRPDNPATLLWSGICRCCKNAPPAPTLNQSKIKASKRNRCVTPFEGRCFVQVDQRCEGRRWCEDRRKVVKAVAGRWAST